MRENQFLTSLDAAKQPIYRVQNLLCPPKAKNIEEKNI